MEVTLSLSSLMKEALCVFTNKAYVKGSIKTGEKPKVLFSYTSSSSITQELVDKVQNQGLPKIKEAKTEGTCDPKLTKYRYYSVFPSHYNLSMSDLEKPN